MYGFTRKKVPKYSFLFYGMSIRERLLFKKRQPRILLNDGRSVSEDHRDRSLGSFPAIKPRDLSLRSSYFSLTGNTTEE
jgi:hypothetical protein